MSYPVRLSYKVYFLLNLLLCYPVNITHARYVPTLASLEFCINKSFLSDFQKGFCFSPIKIARELHIHAKSISLIQTCYFSKSKADIVSGLISLHHLPLVRVCVYKPFFLWWFALKYFIPGKNRVSSKFKKWVTPIRSRVQSGKSFFFIVVVVVSAI